MEYEETNQKTQVHGEGVIEDVCDDHVMMSDIDCIWWNIYGIWGIPYWIQEALVQDFDDFDHFVGNQVNEEDKPESNDNYNYLVDNYNYVEDVETDMVDFNLNIEIYEKFVGRGVTQERMDDIDDKLEDCDVICNDEFDSLEKDYDEDNKRISIRQSIKRLVILESLCWS